MEAEERARLFQAAFDKTRAADYSAALKEFEFLETQSEHPRDIALIRLFQVSCLTDMGKPVEASERIRSVDERQLGVVDQVNYAYEYARIKRAIGEKQSALVQTQDALQAIALIDDQYPTKHIVTLNLLTLLGVLLSECGQCDFAIPILEKITIDDPSWAEARLHLGDCYYKKKHYREAIREYETVISREREIHPIFFWGALRNAGYAFYDLEEYAKAVEYLTKVVDKYDAYPDTKRELFDILASAYLHVGTPSDAQKYRYPSSGSQLVQ
jgi:tetratricopeptide (TPR) repeat protein